MGARSDLGAPNIVVSVDLRTGRDRGYLCRRVTGMPVKCIRGDTSNTTCAAVQTRL